MFRLIGMGLAVLFIAVGSALMAAHKALYYEEVEARVDNIERICAMTVTFGDASSETREACSNSSDWSEIVAKPHSERRKVEGEATITVSYLSPADNQQHSATLSFNGRDREFYEINYGGMMKILAHTSEPEKIRKL
ncbi:hypothetical protein [Sphingomicrobium flavum]|uniref:hypothetical protein n=1 Tax=Sphingomicrobium flavum TaxID=1229164 RepID=UPI0021AD850E|nr:hypothetical protein [Sphingomicrobium flavum]